FHSVGINITFLIVQGAVVVVIGRTLTYDTHRSAVTRHNLAGVWLFSTPCHTVTDVVVNLYAEFTEIKLNGVGSTHSTGKCQSQGGFFKHYFHGFACLHFYTPQSLIEKRQSSLQSTEQQ